MHGWIVLKNSAGRALRRGAADVLARDVLYCGGGFHAGETVYITFRAVDGGQYVVASSVIGVGEDLLQQLLCTPGATEVVVRGQDIKLLW